MLAVSDLVVNYGEVQAVDGISIKVKAGELVSITGANGAGKSSMLNAIAGILAVASGKIVFAGEDITGLRAHQIVEKGIVQVPEGRQLFATLTVRENLLAGRYADSRFLLDQVIPESIVQRFPVLGERLDSLGSSLSGGQAQMLALARGLMNRPDLLLLDEPTLGLAPIAVKEVFDLILQLRDQGLTILVVEQNVRQVLEISDYAYVVEGGRIVMEGKGGELLNNSSLVESYLGVANEPAIARST
ncbi:MAG: ABC transporter ATP-binding protein [Arenicellales bacterium]|nr:ABC transporter ATP-binding protein [Arenicellales bacterium]